MVMKGYGKLGKDAVKDKPSKGIAPDKGLNDDSSGWETQEEVTVSASSDGEEAGDKEDGHTDKPNKPKLLAAAKPKLPKKHLGKAKKASPSVSGVSYGEVGSSLGSSSGSPDDSFASGAQSKSHNSYASVDFDLYKKSKPGQAKAHALANVNDSIELLKEHHTDHVPLHGPASYTQSNYDYKIAASSLSGSYSSEESVEDEEDDIGTPHSSFDSYYD